VFAILPTNGGVKCESITTDVVEKSVVLSILHLGWAFLPDRLSHNLWHTACCVDTLCSTGSAITAVRLTNGSPSWSSWMRS